MSRICEISCASTLSPLCGQSEHSFHPVVVTRNVPDRRDHSEWRQPRYGGRVPDRPVMDKQREWETPIQFYTITTRTCLSYHNQAYPDWYDVSWQPPKTWIETRLEGNVNGDCFSDIEFQAFNLCPVILFYTSKFVLLSFLNLWFKNFNKNDWHKIIMIIKK